MASCRPNAQPPGAFWEFVPLEEFLEHEWILQWKDRSPDPDSGGYHVHRQLKIKLVHDSRSASSGKCHHVTR